MFFQLLAATEVRKVFALGWFPPSPQDVSVPIRCVQQFSLFAYLSARPQEISISYLAHLLDCAALGTPANLENVASELHVNA